MNVKSKASKAVSIILSVVMALTIFGGMPTRAFAAASFDPTKECPMDTEIDFGDGVYVLSDMFAHDEDLPGGDYRMKLSGVAELTGGGLFQSESGKNFSTIFVDQDFPYYDASGEQLGVDDTLNVRSIETDEEVPIAIEVVEGNGTFANPYIFKAVFAKKHYHDGIDFQPWYYSSSLPQTAGDYYLVCDVEIDDTWEISGTGMTINLCLNGHKIKHKGIGSAISITGNASLALHDETGNGAITGGYGTLFGGGVCVGSLTSGGIFDMYGGNITGNELDMEDTDGTKVDSCGGGVAVINGIFRMHNGVVSSNAATRGAGVYVGALSDGNAIFELDGGTIAYNDGIGIYIDEDDPADSAQTIFRLDGESTIKENDADIYLAPDQVIQIGSNRKLYLNDGLTSSSIMMLTDAGVPHGGVFTMDYTKSGNMEADAPKLFSSFYPGFEVNCVDGEVALTDKPMTSYTVVFKDGDKVISQQTVIEGGLAQPFQDPTKEDMHFDGWVYEDGTPYFFLDVIRRDTTLKATWSTTPIVGTCTITFMDGETEVDKQTVAVGGTAEAFQNPTKDGKEFVNWQYRDGTVYNFTDRVAADTVVYANWKDVVVKDTCMVRFVDGYDLSIIDEQEVKTGGTAVAFQDPIKEDFEFYGWYYSDGTEFHFTDTITEDKVVFAVWKRTGSGVEVGVFVDPNLANDVTLNLGFRQDLIDEALADGMHENDFIFQLLSFSRLEDSLAEAVFPVLATLANMTFINSNNTVVDYVDIDIMKTIYHLDAVDEDDEMEIESVTELPRPIEVGINLEELGVTGNYDAIQVIRSHDWTIPDLDGRVIVADDGVLRDGNDDALIVRDGNDGGLDDMLLDDALREKVEQGAIEDLLKLLNDDNVDNDGEAMAQLMKLLDELNAAFDKGLGTIYFDRLSQAPTKEEDFSDGTFFVNESTGTLYLYTQYFSDCCFAIVHTDESISTVTYEDSENTSEKIEAWVVTGTWVSLPELIDTDGIHEFLGWKVKGGDSKIYKDIYQVQGDVTMVAQWKKKGGSSSRGGGGGGGGGTVVTPNPAVDPTKPTEDPNKPTDKPTDNPTETATPSNVTAYNFDDVAKDAWYYDDVQYVTGHGIMKGVSGNAFDPDGKTTRGMFATVLYRLNGASASELEMPFTDVASGVYYYDPIAWAYNNSIVLGYGDGKFGPDDLLTREQFVAMVYRYAKFMGYDTSFKGGALARFDDADQVSEYAYDASEWAIENEIISGRDNNKLDPQAEISRAETAAILHRFNERFGASAKS